MTKKDKNIFIITIFAIIVIFAWTLSKYIQSQKNENAPIDAADIENINTKDINNESTDTQTDTIPVISAKKLYNDLFVDKNILIVDTRTPEQFRKGHIENSIYITELDTARLNRTIVFVTETGEEESLLSKYRDLSDSNKVFNLKNGFSSWLNAGYNVISQEIEKSFINISKVTFVEPRDLDALMKDTSQNKDLVILDARRTGNYQKEHIPNSINIPFEEIELRHKELPLTKKIFIYGFDEDSGFEASVLLYDLGHINITTITGGFNAWKEYGYPTIH